MNFKKIWITATLMMFLLIGLSIMTPGTINAQGKASTDEQKTMWCNIQSGDFYALCQDKDFIKGLTPEQRKQLDTEWQRRAPTMTPAERELYYPAGRRYYNQ
jgi:hypothetical protein